MAEFDAKKFVEGEVTFGQVEELKKDELLILAAYLSLAIQKGEKKSAIRFAVTQKLVADGQLKEPDRPPHMSDSDVKQGKDMSELQYELELRKMEMEREDRQREREDRQIERERDREKEREEREFRERENERDREFKLKELELQKENRGYRGSTSVNADVARNIKLVPKFNEKEVDKYFLHFEKIAESMEWQKNLWPLLLQSVLIGKAQEVYTALSVEQSADYDVVKRTIMQAYELVPEAYRQKFRYLYKQTSQTHVEFSREKENLFDRWCASMEVKAEFESLRQLILLEEFKKCISRDVKTHLEEQKVKDIKNAAIMADEYALTHKQHFQKIQGDKKGFQGNYEKRSGHVGNHDPHKGGADGTRSNVSMIPKPKVFNGQGYGQGQGQRTFEGVCYICRKPGHISLRCPARKRSEGKGTALALVSCRLPRVVEPLMEVSIEKNVKMEKCDTVSKPDGFESFLSQGTVSLLNDGTGVEEDVPIVILRDTGAAQTVLLEGVLPVSEATSDQASVLVSGIGGTFAPIPLHVINLKCGLVAGPVSVGIVSKIPVEGVSLLLGNDLAGDKVMMNPCMCKTPVINEGTKVLEIENPGLFPACVVTRAMANRANKTNTESVKGDNGDMSVALSDTFFANIDDPTGQQVDHSGVMSQGQGEMSQGQGERSMFDRNALIKEQKSDPEIGLLINDSLTDEEIKEVPVGYFHKSGVLMRKFRPPDVPAEDEWKIVNQIVVPPSFRGEILKTAHDLPLAGHLGVTKTHDRILQHFFWPALRQDVVKFCKTCHICQMVGKPNQKIKAAPLLPIPAFDEPFSRVIVDCVGPLPKTKSGNNYLLTIMCASTRFPEAIPLRTITAQAITKALKKFFTFVGLPKSLQSDQGTNFTSNIFQKVMTQLGIQHFKSSAYHPQSQGALERYHQTLKTMIKTYCLENEKDWDEGIPMLLFATREVVQESLGFSPFELVFGHTVRGPLQIIQEEWLKETSSHNLIDYVSEFRYKLLKARELAIVNLKETQSKMKTWYDKKARERVFDPGDKVLVLLPIQGEPLRAKFSGPYTIESKVNDLNYVVLTPDRRKAKQLCHVNMLKAYFDRSEHSVPVATVQRRVNEKVEVCQEVAPEEMDPECVVKLKNSEVLANLESKVTHLEPTQQKEITDLIREYEYLFSDTPGRTNLTCHDVDTGHARPIKQHPYRLSPSKLKQVRKELKYMIENKIIEPSESEWCSPIILIPKPDGTQRFCIDFRKVNDVTRTDSFPIPRIDDCIDRIGQAKYVTKFDLLKGYWQVPLSDRAKAVSAFVTPDGLYHCNVMPFGMKNAPATFSRLMNRVICGLEGCVIYIDDAIIYSDTWEEHVQRIRAFFDRLMEANLTVNLAKSEFAQAFVTYLGHVVGQGQVKPREAKIQSIVSYPVPTTRKELMRFLGMAGYYRKFCSNFSDIVIPLTNLLGKQATFCWSTSCQQAFERVKAILMNSPVLSAPDFEKPFKLAVDASDLGVGAVMFQEDTQGIEHPICFFSKKLNKHQKNYSTIEKETLALILALQHFEVYVSSGPFPVEIFTDHNPLTFLSKMKNHNQRLLRWSLFLQEYNLEIRHIRGKENVVADALSRA
jgi:hypothetical protein